MDTEQKKRRLYREFPSVALYEDGTPKNLLQQFQELDTIIAQMNKSIRQDEALRTQKNENK
jgi:hypothetical protein